jgi:MFS family permease
VWLLAVVIPLIPIGAALLFPATTALLSRSTESSDLGLTMGIAQTFAGISRLAAPVSSTAMFEHIGRSAPFFFAAAMAGAGSLLAKGLGRRIGDREQITPPA